MKVTDYIVRFLADKGITDAFGYPGGMVTDLLESFSKYAEEIEAHVTYHEQGAAFCACGYAQSSGKTGVAYATSGPGATNLITGICNAYFDSIPVIFITGQVNTFEAKGAYGVRQKGFQETDILTMVQGVTKYSVYVDRAESIRFYLEKAYWIANEGRKGPVLLDIPMNIQKEEIKMKELQSYEIPNNEDSKTIQEGIESIEKELKSAKRPCFLIGAGGNEPETSDLIAVLQKQHQIPIVTSMIAGDAGAGAGEMNYGFLGTYGNRTANFIVAKCDLLIAMGVRLDIRQTGADKQNFAPGAKLIRVDVDAGELTAKVKEDEIQICCQLKDLLKKLLKTEYISRDFGDWVKICNYMKTRLEGYDEGKPNEIIEKISECIEEDTLITADVGQNQVWVAQSFIRKKNQRILFSGGHGAMGYSLPAAIGACYGSGRPVVSFNGDGGIQMNIQELQFIVRENLPVTVIVLNNFSLGMIRHFQEMYFGSNYVQTVPLAGYTVPSFEKIAAAYGLEYFSVRGKNDIEKEMFSKKKPVFVEIFLEEDTYAFPKLEYGKPNQDQEPLIDRKVYEELMEL